MGNEIGRFVGSPVDVDFECSQREQPAGAACGTVGYKLFEGELD